MTAGVIRRDPTGVSAPKKSISTMAGAQTVRPDRHSSRMRAFVPAYRARGERRRARTKPDYTVGLSVRFLSICYGAEQSVRLTIYPVSEVKRVGIAIVTAHSEIKRPEPTRPAR